MLKYNNFKVINEKNKNKLSDTKQIINLRLFLEKSVIILR